jgi:hypothetical protein
VRNGTKFVINFRSLVLHFPRGGIPHPQVAPDMASETSVVQVAVNGRPQNGARAETSEKPQSCRRRRPRSAGVHEAGERPNTPLDGVRKQRRRGIRRRDGAKGGESSRGAASRRKGRPPGECTKCWKKKKNPRNNRPPRSPPPG